MTLGGIAVAIGDLVDDSMWMSKTFTVDCARDRQLPSTEQRPALDVVFAASSEIRNSIVYATLIVVLVVMPLFMMSGIEGDCSRRWDRLHRCIALFVGRFADLHTRAGKHSFATSALLG